jgi:hypothetical protein
MSVVTAKSGLKVIAILEAAELLNVVIPDGQPRLVLTIRLPDGMVTADLNAQSVRRAIATVREQGVEAVAAILQGRLSGNVITEAGLSVQPKGPRKAPPSDDAVF